MMLIKWFERTLMLESFDFKTIVSQLRKTY